MTLWTVSVYHKGSKLRPCKRWDAYLTMAHAQYDGWCYHYQVPDELVSEVLELGAQRLTGSFACQETA